jgi:hypothetical protein
VENKNRFINQNDLPDDNKPKDIPKVEDVFNVPIDNNGIQDEVEVLDLNSVDNMNVNQVGNEIPQLAGMKSNDTFVSKAPVSNFSKKDESIFDDNVLLNSFIGKHCEIIRNKIYNFSALFFGVLYMFYRKMYFYGIVGIISYLLLSLFVKSIYFLGIVNIILFFSFNSIYLSYANNKIKSFKISFPHSSMDQLSALCTNKGGTSIFGAFIGIVSIVVLTFIFIFITMNLGIASSITSLIKF